MKKLGLIAAGILLSAGLIAFAASTDNNDNKKATDCAKTCSPTAACDKSCDKSLCCEASGACVPCDPASCKPAKK